MNNVDVKLVGNSLVITIDATQSFGPSKSAKSTQIASTLGNQEIAPDVYLSVNCYKTKDMTVAQRTALLGGLAL